MRKKYIKPILETENILERVVLACNLQAGTACEGTPPTSNS